MSSNENPLNSIFKVSKGKCTEEINSINKIDNFFKYILDEKIPSKNRCQVIEELINKLKVNQYLCEYFSSFENQSIYIFLIQLYINKSNSPDLRISIINLINELKINLDIYKNVYDYLFQKISAIYREEEKYSNELLYDYLTLLNTFLGDTINHLKPRNYFSCSGEGYFEVDLSNFKLKIGCSFTFIINFKIGVSTYSEQNPDKANISNLISINFSNGENVDFELHYPMLLIVKKIQDNFIKTLPFEEWINLIINVVCDNKNNLIVFCYCNGENRLTPFTMKKTKLTGNDTINSIKFFNNFYGQVSSMTFLSSQKDFGFPGVNASEFLLEFKQFKEGLWKKKKIEYFIKLLQDFDAVGIEKAKSKTVWKKQINIEKFEKIEKENAKLIDNLIFIYTPLNYYEDNKNILGNVVGSLNMKFTGNIRPHKYQCLQKKMGSMGVITNLLPIAEMFIIHPEMLNEKNFGRYLNIIKDLLNNRKYNMKFITDCSFFEILSLFIEKYPKHIFTLQILGSFTDIGKCMFGNNIESLSSIYFEHILLNEKILSKYSEDLQIKFWENILLFCQSDSSQIEVFVNMNRICLILRFYDKNKYTEMCCEHHLSMIKDEFKGSKNIMNPPMNTKLAKIKDIMNVIINSIDPEKAFSLFKLLTLDLSPCLTEFILNIFINAFQKQTQNDKWKDDFIKVLVNNKFETIIGNTFVNSLPEIKLSLLNLMFEINFRLLKTKNILNFKALEKTIKQILLPQDNFYLQGKNNNDNTTIQSTSGLNNKNENPHKTTNDNNQNKTNLEKDKIKMNASINAKSNIIKIDDKKNEQKNNVTGISAYGNKKDTQKFEPKKQIKVGGNNKISSMISKLQNMSGGKFPGMMGPKPETFKPQKTIDEKSNLSKSVMVSSPINLNNSSNEKKTKNDIGNVNKNNISSQSSYNGISKLLKNKNNEIIIFKDNIYYDYIEKVYKLFLLWSLNLPPSFDFDKINFKTSKLESTNALELLLTMAIEINDIEFYLKCVVNIESLSLDPQNAYRIVANDKIISSLLDIAYRYYRTDDKLKETCYNIIKSILLNCYMNSLLHLEKTHEIYPCDKVETLFLWGDKTIFNEKNSRHKDVFFDFMSEFLFEYLTAFKIKYEPKMDFNIANFTSNPSKNFYLKRH